MIFGSVGRWRVGPCRSSRIGSDRTEMLVREELRANSRETEKKLGLAFPHQRVQLLWARTPGRGYRSERPPGIPEFPEIPEIPENPENANEIPAPYHENRLLASRNPEIQKIQKK